MGLPSPPLTAPHAPLAPIPLVPYAPVTALTIALTIPTVSTIVPTDLPTGLTIRPLCSPRLAWRPQRVTPGGAWDDPARTWAWNAALWATLGALRIHDLARLVQTAGQDSLACALLELARGRARYALRKLEEFRCLRCLHHCLATIPALGAP